LKTVITGIIFIFSIQFLNSYIIFKGIKH
jgi:hypothetical protein